MRIAVVLQLLPNSCTPSVSAITGEIVDRLRTKGAKVDLLIPDAQSFEVAALRPEHDLYVLKSKTPISLSLVAALARAGANVVNTVPSCLLTRDKIATTAVLAAHGVAVPPSWATGEPSLLGPLLEKPLWLKPPGGSQGVGVCRLSHIADLDGQASCTDVYGLPLPLFVQREVPHRGRDLKVYVVGERTWTITRPFPARTLEEKLGTPSVLSPAIRTAAHACGRALGLELYGVDFLVSGDRFFAVDVNAFPGFKGVADGPRHIAEYLYKRALRAEASPSRQVW